MPTLKFERVVSCSSEDPNFPATNLLACESFKKWKCKSAGDKEAVVILQLESPSYISGIDIGNEGSGLVEVLVGRQSSDEFKVLLVASSFMSPMESRMGENKNRVRMFSKDNLCEGVVDEKWDRVKVVCRQPFNMQLQYGLSFITIHSPEAPKVGKIELKVKNEEDPFKAGYLFARRKELLQDEEPLKGAAAIRAASRPEALQQQATPKKNKVLEELQQKKNTPSSSSSENSPRANTPTSVKRRSPSPQQDSSSDKPKKLKPIDSPALDKPKKVNATDSPSVDKPKKLKVDSPHMNGTSDSGSSSVHKAKKHKPGDSNSLQDDSSGSSSERRVRPSDDTVRNGPSKRKLVKKNHLTKPFNRLLEGVVFVISGYQNPERGNVRSMALEMGAKYKPDWDYNCTHLVCAFKNTPKYQQVQGLGHIVSKEWIEQCYAQRKRLPWRRHALDKAERKIPESEDEIEEAVEEKRDSTPSPTPEDGSDQGPLSGSDTDEEIQRVQQQRRHNPAFDSDTEVDEPSSPITDRDLKISPLALCPKGNFKEDAKFYLADKLSLKDELNLQRAMYHHCGILVNADSEECDFIISDRPREEHQEALQRWPQAEVIPLHGMFLPDKKTK